MNIPCSSSVRDAGISLIPSVISVINRSDLNPQSDFAMWCWESFNRTGNTTAGVVEALLKYLLLIVLFMSLFVSLCVFSSTANSLPRRYGTFVLSSFRLTVISSSFSFLARFIRIRQALMKPARAELIDRSTFARFRIALYIGTGYGVFSRIERIRSPPRSGEDALSLEFCGTVSLNRRYT